MANDESQEMNEELEYLLAEQNAMNRWLYHYKRATERPAAHYDAARGILMQILTPQIELTLDEKGLPIWRTTNI